MAQMCPIRSAVKGEEAATGSHHSVSPEPTKSFEDELYDEEDDSDSDTTDTGEDEEWDELDSSDESEESYSDILDMMGLNCTGLMLASLTVTTTPSINPNSNSTVCDSLSSNGGTTSVSTSSATSSQLSNGLSFKFPSCPFTARGSSSSISVPMNNTEKHSVASTSTSAAVNIPNVFNNISYDDFDFSLDSMSPDSFELPPLTEEDIKRNQDMAKKDEELGEAAIEANRKWLELVDTWRAELGERAYLMDIELSDLPDVEDEDEVEKMDYETSEVIISNSAPNLHHEMFIDIKMDYVDGSSQLYHSSPCLRSSIVITKNCNHNFPRDTFTKQNQKIRFNTKAVVHYIEKGAECRQPYWQQVARDNARFKKRITEMYAPILVPVYAAKHRQQVYNDRFAEKEQQQ